MTIVDFYQSISNEIKISAFLIFTEIVVFPKTLIDSRMKLYLHFVWEYKVFVIFQPEK
ncbi:hypothetical protein CMALT430_320006 [Carnobacterium maltaromaticum]|nr:hypothetical protein CMALT430_320006 [Carnobacterium maltaromaticum]